MVDNPPLYCVVGLGLLNESGLAAFAARHDAKISHVKMWPQCVSAFGSQERP
jgi:hypothetical protein